MSLAGLCLIVRLVVLAGQIEKPAALGHQSEQRIGASRLRLVGSSVAAQ